MSEITIIGLGMMGAAIANTLRKSGVSLTVWNRSVEKAEALESENVVVAQTILDAVQASPAAIVCVDAPGSIFSLFGNSQFEPLLNGRTIIQLSTCLPKQAREAEKWLASRKAGYLDGAIHCGPEGLGTSGGNILISGHSSAFEPVSGLINLLGGQIDYLGDDIAAASTLDLAWLSMRFGEFMGMLHAANVCHSEGIEIEKFISMFPDNPRIQHHVGTIRDGTYDERTATLSVWQASLELLRQQALDAGIKPDFPNLVGGLFEKAMEAGYGEEHVMALFKALRDN